jgi:hypothetical protein
MSISTSTETPISTTRISTARTIKITFKRAGKNRGEVFNTIRAIEKAWAIEIRVRLRSSTKGAMPRLPSRESSSVAGRRVVGRNWRVKEEVRAVAREVSATKVDQGTRVAISEIAAVREVAKEGSATAGVEVVQAIGLVELVVGAAGEEAERHFKAWVEGATFVARARVARPAEAVAEVRVEEEEVVVGVVAAVVAVDECAGGAVNPRDENGFLIHNYSRFQQRWVIMTLLRR